MKTHSKLGIALSLLSVLAGNAIAHNDQQTVAVMTTLKADYALPSLSVAISKNDEVVFAHALGYADVEQKILATPRTQYSVGSPAKPMTGLAVARLADQNKLALNDVVSDYVPKPTYTKTFTISQLAAHTAGVPHNTPERDSAEFDTPKDHTSPFDAFYVFDKHPLLFPANTDFAYSSNGYILLSAVVEAAADKPYTKVMEEDIWQPLGMMHTALDLAESETDEAKYYATFTNDQQFQLAPAKRDRSFLFGGGGFVSTPTDMVRMARALYHPSFLSDKAKQVLQQPIALDDGTINKQNYALGWRVGAMSLSENSEKTFTVLHHGGVTDNAANAYVLVIPQCKASIAFATNTVPDKFWQMRGKMARVLRSYIEESECAEQHTTSAL